MKIKSILQVVEHVVLVAIIAGSIGFWIGNSYGSSHVDIKSLKTAENASK